MKFEWYVLNWDYNRQQAYMFNIFQNSIVNENCYKAVKKYVRSPSKYKYIDYMKDITYTGFEALCKDIRGILQHQLWSRCEYEILVGNDFSDKQEKWDCYRQAEPNIAAIARELIWQYKHLRSQNVTTKDDT